MNQLRLGFQAKQTMLGRGGDRTRFRSLWREWELDAILACAALREPDSIRLVANGNHIKPVVFRDRAGMIVSSAITQIRRAGASISLSRVEDFSNAILSLSRGLEVAFECPVQCNLYITPGESQGLGRHSDPHDVLVLQLQGTKNWEIEGFRNEGDSSETVLQSGDWLFVPHGVRHNVRNRNAETSIHLTIGFHPLTWGAVLKDAVVSARKVVPKLSERVPHPREATGIESCGDLLQPFLDVAGRYRRYRENFKALEVPVPAAEIPQRAQLDAIDEATRFVWRRESAMLSESNGASAVDLAYRRAPLVLRSELRTAIGLMPEQGEFCSTSLDLESDATGRQLCRLLASIGALELVG